VPQGGITTAAVAPPAVPAPVVRTLAAVPTPLAPHND
jgi:hypothetical protein